jgi:hypothetical protein
MRDVYWTGERVAGALLASSFLLMLTALLIMLMSGAITGFGPMISGDIGRAATYTNTFQWLILLFIFAWVLQSVGLGLFAHLMARAGESEIAIATFIIVLIATITAVINFGFRMTIELWAAGELAVGRALPPLYQPLRTWTSDLFHLGYVMHPVAMVGMGWGILRSGILERWVGWAAIGWSGLTLLGALAGAGAPAVPLLMPAAIGVVLLWAG